MSEIIFNPSPSASNFESQIENFQTTLASLNQQVIILQEALQEKEQEVAELEMRLVQSSQENAPAVKLSSQQIKLKQDKALSIAGVLVKLYQFLVPPRKDAASLD